MSGTASLEFRAAGLEDEADILALATRTLGWGGESRWADLYRWKHDENSFGRSPRWVAVDGDRVVGFRVFLRWEFVENDGTIRRAVRAVDTATDPDYQGKGIFTRLTTAALEDLRHDGVDFVFNTPNDQSRPGYLKMGWEVVGRPSVAVLPTGPAGLIRLPGARAAAELWSEPCTAGRPAADVFAEDAVSAIPEALLAPPIERRLRTNRSAAHLRWRYGLAGLHYRVIAIDDDLSGGFAVFRNRRRGSATEATLTELAVPSGSDAATRRRALVRAVARQSGADYVLTGAFDGAARTPAATTDRLAPVVTWRSVVASTAPSLAEWSLSMGDLELF